MQNELAVGIVTNVLHRRGYGFIRDAEDRDHFFHRNDVRDVSFSDLTPNTFVTFKPVENGRWKQNGRRALNVRVTG